MPRRKSAFKTPRDWLVSGTWPTGTFASDAPEPVAHAVAIAVALNDALEGKNRSTVAAEAEVDRSTMYDILAGKTWADTVTLAKLEAYLQSAIWPREPAPALNRTST